MTKTMKLSTFTNLHKLPIYLRNLNRTALAAKEAAAKMESREKELRTEIAQNRTIINSLHTQLHKLEERNSELEHMVTTVRESKKEPQKAGAAELFANNPLNDKFYLELENNLRGTEAEIQERQKTYIKLFKKTGIDYAKHPVVDLGSGRGEFIELLHKNDIRAIGVDLNKSMVKRSTDKGLEATAADAITHLKKAKSGSLGGITGFHIAEHIPFEQLIILVAEARRVLVKGGFLLMQTPNPENLTVGAYTFHMDPSHIKPIPPALLQFTASFKGFERAEILRDQPELSDKHIQELTANKHLQEVYRRIYGPRDYALVAYK